MRKGASFPFLPGLAGAVRFLLLACVLLAVRGAAADLGARRVLILTSYGGGRPGVQTLLQGFRSSLSQGGISMEQVFSENLDLERNRGEAFRRSLAGTLRLKYAGRRIDLVYAVEQPALDFLLRDLPGLAPGAPVILGRALPPGPGQGGGHRFVIQMMAYDVEGTLHRAMELFPATRQVLFVAGSTGSDRAVLAGAVRAMAPWQGRVACQDTAGLTLDQTLARVRDPDPGTVIVVLPFDRDGEGRTVVQMEMAFNVAAAAGAPVFTLWDDVVGQGAVGGNVFNFFDVGRQAGACALDLLAGRRVLAAPVTDLPARSTPKFDWPQIQRWHGDPARLPGDSVFIHRPPSLWQQHRKEVLAAAVFLLAQTLLIVLLLVERHLRNLARRCLRESEERFRMAMEATSDGLWDWDIATGLTYFSPASATMLGYRPGAFPDRMAAWMEMVLPEDRPGAMAAMQACVDGAMPGFQAEYRVRCQDGAVKWILVRAKAVSRDGQGRALRMTGTHVDTTGLRQSEEKFNRVFQFIPLGACVATLAEGRYLLVNRQFCEYLGYGEAELMGQGAVSMGIWVNPEDRARVLSALEQRAIVTDFEVQLRRKDGSLRWMNYSGQKILMDGSECLLTGIVDITERRQAEEHQRLLETQLQQAQKMESLGTLVAGVAHNVNHVLAIVMGTASLREQAAADAADQEAYANIGQVCRRGREVVRSLIRFAQPTLAIRAPLEIHGAIREVRALLEGTTLNRVRILEDFAPEPLWMDGDPGSINHALMNVCINAVDAMAGGGVLTLRTRALDGGQFQVAVEDSGCGMAPETLARVMEPFFTTKEVGKGTGLGLSMTYGVVKAHGGAIRFASQPGQGTRVTLRFPRVPAPAREAAPAAAPPAVLPTAVFLVDDEEDVRFLMTRMLLKAGIRQVRTFPGGEAVLEALRSETAPDLVILDQNMPGLSGVQTLERIRALDPGLKILISSGQPEIEEWACFRQPGVGVISKPFNLEEIQGKLAQFTP